MYPNRIMNLQDFYKIYKHKAIYSDGLRITTTTNAV